MTLPGVQLSVQYTLALSSATPVGQDCSVASVLTAPPSRATSTRALLLLSAT